MWNPVYFGLFPVEHDHTFDSLTRELTAARTTRQRSAVPAVKEYKYNKARAEVVGGRRLGEGVHRPIRKRGRSGTCSNDP